MARTVTPMAPAPTEVSVTRRPKITPNSTVRGVRCGTMTWSSGGKQPGRGRQAARGEAQYDRPFDVARHVMAPAAGGLGDGGIKEIGADGRLRAHAETRDEQRRHQRAAADAGQAD